MHAIGWNHKNIQYILYLINIMLVEESIVRKFKIVYHSILALVDYSF